MVVNRQGWCGLLLAIVTCFSIETAAQPTAWLEQPITITFTDEPLETALSAIAHRGGFTFSYNPSVIGTPRRVTANYANKTVRQVLDDLFKGTVTYKVRGQYVILGKAKKTEESQPVKVSGYIIDESTGKAITDATVYDPVTLASALTDASGYFEMDIQKPPQDLTLAIRKVTYTDTLLTFPRGQQKLLRIPMKLNQEISTVADSMSQKLKRFWSKSGLFKRQRINMANVSDTIYRTFQISFVPFAGSNHGLSGNVVNDYSVNILGGYAMGLRKFEVGGVFNLERADVAGVQVAGVFNHVQGKVDGVQIAGVANANHGPVRGVVLGGVVNVSDATSEAVQVAGVVNATHGDQVLPHVAGVLNLTTGESRTQVAGVLNLSGGSFQEAQVAGVVNVAGGDVTGTQVAGLLNLTMGDVEGAQVGVLNVARKVKGSQVGVFNFSDSVDGAAIGLLSFIARGYHKLEIAADEVFLTNLSFRTGTSLFHNILTAGFKPNTLGDPATSWTFGYGLGTAPALSKNVALNIDVTSNQIMEGNMLRHLNLLNKLFVGVDVQLTPRVSLVAGGTLNMYLTDVDDNGYWPLFTNVNPSLLTNKIVNDDTRMRTWLGGKVGVRFF